MSEIYPRNAMMIQQTIKYGQCNISYYQNTGNIPYDPLNRCRKSI